MTRLTVKPRCHERSNHAAGTDHILSLLLGSRKVEKRFLITERNTVNAEEKRKGC